MFLTLIVFISQVSAVAPIGAAQRAAEQLYYLSPAARGAVSCHLQTAQEQQREFEKGFAVRISNVERRELAALGPYDGYDIIPIGSCTRGSGAAKKRFAKAIREFNAALTELERRYP
ncbi:MAG: hypothetical protein EOO38_22630 [Cytophagaceae bacterium]|nr:MAG: hypothetical protein EOO38_22630 [Cytophagaceae bacterium]